MTQQELYNFIDHLIGFEAIGVTDHDETVERPISPRVQSYLLGALSQRLGTQTLSVYTVIRGVDRKPAQVLASYLREAADALDPPKSCGWMPITEVAKDVAERPLAVADFAETIRHLIMIYDVGLVVPEPPMKFVDDVNKLRLALFNIGGPRSMTHAQDDQKFTPGK